MWRFFKRVIAVLAILLPIAGYAQTAQHNAATHNQVSTPSEVPTMPSEAEISDLVSKASEYIDTYRLTFKNAKASLDKAPNPGFYEQAMALCDQASGVISTIKKDGATAVSLVVLLTVLDDMTLKRASASTMIVALSENKSNRNDHAMQDFQDLAQAEKNCYDISELLSHATIRYISVEETTLRTLLDREKQH